MMTSAPNFSDNCDDLPLLVDTRSQPLRVARLRSRVFCPYISLMPALDAPPPSDEPRDHASERHNARLGLVLFAVYLAAYAAFVGVSAFAPSVMDATVGRLNVAVVYGLALIGGAVLLAVVYAMLCRTPAGVGK